MKYKCVWIVLLLFFASETRSQNQEANNGGYSIDVNIPKSVGQTLYLAKYSNEAVYSIDSVIVSPKGKALFASDSRLPEGQYLLYKRPDIQMEFLLGKEQNNIHIRLDENNLQNSSITGSRDTELFWNYINHVNKISSELNTVDSLLNNTKSEAEKAGLLERRVAVENRIVDYMKSQVEKYPTQWFGVFLKGTLPVELPIKSPSTMEEANINKSYLRNHYFDNIDLTDYRLWNTNYFPQMVDYYLYKQIPQIPDTVAFEASRLVSKTAKSNDSFKEMLSYILNSAMKSNYMGMENVWAKLAEDYILDKNLSWIDSEKTARISSLYEALKFNRIGMTATNLRLATINGDTINTNEVAADYTVLYFFNPTCAHCQHTTAFINDNIHQKYKNKGVQIIAIDIDSNTELWKNYVESNNMSEWINCSDPNYKSAYWMYYDTSAVPMIYVLDKNKKIIARKVDGDNLSRIFDYYIK